MSRVNLRDYDNSWYRPGRPLLWQAVWFFIGLPLLRCALLPSSAFRVWLLRRFGARLGTGVVIKPGVRVKYPWHLEVGDCCWLGEDCWIDNLTTVTLGDSVCISQGAYLCTGNHNWSDPSFGLMTKSIVLGNGAWVGAKTLLAPGVELGAGAIASAGSVVMRNIPAFEIHAGNPAAFVKHRRIKTDGDDFDLERELNVAPVAARASA
jgi:putative colanic acid biosynthesis acetyltransferase WcaF